MRYQNPRPDRDKESHVSSWQLTGALLLLASAAYGAGAPTVTIMQIQGHGARSPLEGEAVETSGIVTQCARNRRHCWIQDARGDGDPATSDGVLIDLGGRHASSPRLRPGDRVEIIARVRERQFGAALPRTELSRVYRLVVLSRDHPLPAAVPLHSLPRQSIPEAIARWESLEGMRVRVDAGVVVGPTTRFGEFTLVSEADARPGSGYEPSTRHLLLRSLPDGGVDYNPERIIVDDDSAPAPDVRPGDTIQSLLGVVDYSFGNYKIQYAQLRHRTSSPSPPQPARPAPGLRIASFNLENLFDTEHSPGKQDRRSTPNERDFETKIAKLTLTLATVLQFPDIVAVQEAENTQVLKMLAERLNRLGDYTYRAVSFESSDPRGIEVGLLWDARRVRFRHAAPLRKRDAAEAFGTESPSPGREPLVGEFQYRGRPLTVVVNHFKSKAGDDPLFGVRQPPRRHTERQRKLQARAVRAYVDQRLHNAPEALIAVLGDLNDFAFAEPGEGDDHPLAILQGSGARRLMPVSDRIPVPQRYSFIYNGNSQLLDHILVSPALYRHLSGARIAHTNADYPDAWRTDPATPWRASDHDPIEAAFQIP